MGISSFFSSLFGKAKETVSEVAESAETFAESAMEKAGDVVKGIKDQVEDVAEAASANMEEMGVADKVEGFVNQAKETASKAAD